MEISQDGLAKYWSLHKKIVHLEDKALQAKNFIEKAKINKKIAEIDGMIERVIIEDRKEEKN